MDKSVRQWGRLSAVRTGGWSDDARNLEAGRGIRQVAFWVNIRGGKNYDSEGREEGCTNHDSDVSFYGARDTVRATRHHAYVSRFILMHDA